MLVHWIQGLRNILLHVMQSCTRSGNRALHGEDKSYRAFVVLGGESQRNAAKHIIASAVDLYQQLFTGALGV
jgi:hypothetical protein